MSINKKMKEMSVFDSPQNKDSFYMSSCNKRRRFNALDNPELIFKNQRERVASEGGMTDNVRKREPLKEPTPKIADDDIQELIERSKERDLSSLDKKGSGKLSMMKLRRDRMLRQ